MTAEVLLLQEIQKGGIIEHTGVGAPQAHHHGLHCRTINCFRLEHRTPGACDTTDGDELASEQVAERRNPSTSLNTKILQENIGRRGIVDRLINTALNIDGGRLTDRQHRIEIDLREFFICLSQNRIAFETVVSEKIVLIQKLNASDNKAIQTLGYSAFLGHHLRLEEKFSILPGYEFENALFSFAIRSGGMRGSAFLEKDFRCSFAAVQLEPSRHFGKKNRLQ